MHFDSCRFTIGGHDWLGTQQIYLARALGWGFTLASTGKVTVILLDETYQQRNLIVNLS